MSQGQVDHVHARAWEWLRVLSTMGVVIYAILLLVEHRRATFSQLFPFLLVAAFQALSAAALLIGRITITDTGIETRSLWRGRRVLPYQSIRRVYFAQQLGVVFIGAGVLDAHVLPLHYDQKHWLGSHVGAHVPRDRISRMACWLLGLQVPPLPANRIRVRHRGNVTLWAAWLVGVSVGPWALLIHFL